jgi:hypothetical protein
MNYAIEEFTRIIYIRCIYGIFGRDITNCTVLANPTHICKDHTSHFGYENGCQSATPAYSIC